MHTQSSRLLSRAVTWSYHILTPVLAVAVILLYLDDHSHEVECDVVRTHRLEVLDDDANAVWILSAEGEGATFDLRGRHGERLWYVERNQRNVQCVLNSPQDSSQWYVGSDREGGMLVGLRRPDGSPGYSLIVSELGYTWLSVINPETGKPSISLTSDEEGRARIDIFDETGQPIWRAPSGADSLSE